MYLSILQDGVMKTIEWYRFNPLCVIFKHYNDSQHIAKLVKQWLSMQNFDVLTWPPRSPFLNPTEHEWARVNWKLNEYPTLAKGMLQLWEHVQVFSIPSPLSSVKSSIIACPIVSKLF